VLSSVCIKNNRSRLIMSCERTQLKDNATTLIRIMQPVHSSVFKAWFDPNCFSPEGKHRSKSIGLLSTCTAGEKSTGRVDGVDRSHNTPFTLYSRFSNRLSNRSYNRFDNRLNGGLTTG